jgi:hypothetical protein
MYEHKRSTTAETPDEDPRGQPTNSTTRTVDQHGLRECMAAKRLRTSATSVESMAEDADESANQEAPPEPDVDAIPSLRTLAPAYDRLLEIATQRLDGPVQTRVRTWEDGEFEIRVYHGYGPHPQRPDTAYHHILRYHSHHDEIVEGLMTVDAETVEKTLIYRTVIDTDGVRVDACRAPNK